MADGRGSQSDCQARARLPGEGAGCSFSKEVTRLARRGQGCQTDCPKRAKAPDGLPAGACTRRCVLRGKQTPPWQPRLLFQIFRTEELVFPWTCDRDVARFSACSRASVACGMTSDRKRLKVARLMHLPKKLTKQKAFQIVEAIDLQMLQGISCACDEGPCEIHGISLVRIIIALARKTMAAQHERRHSATLSCHLPRSLWQQCLLPRLEYVDFTCEDAHKELRHAQIDFGSVVASILCEAPRLLHFWLPSPLEYRVLSPSVFCEVLRMHAWRAGDDHSGSDSAQPSQRPSRRELPRCVSKLRDPDVLNCMRVTTCNDAEELGALYRLMHNLTCMNAFYQNREDNSTMYTSAVFQSFVKGFLNTESDMQPNIRTLGLTGVDLASSGRELARLCNALPKLRSLQIGENANPVGDGADCLLRTDMLRLFAEKAEEQLASLRHLTFFGAVLEGVNIAPILLRTQGLRSLDLSKSDFGDIEAEMLATASLPLAPTLRSLRLGECAVISRAGADSLVRVLNDLGHVSTLEMLGTDMGPDVIQYFIHGLANSSRAGGALQRLEVGYDIDLLPLYSSFQHNGDILSACLSKLKNLHGLCVHGLRIDCKKLQTTGVAHNLKQLFLRDCTGLRTESAGSRFARAAAQVMPSLTRLVFEDCITRATLSGFAEAVARTTSTQPRVRLNELRHLHADGFHMTEPKRRQLMAELHKGCPKLETLGADVFQIDQSDTDDSSSED